MRNSRFYRNKLSPLQVHSSKVIEILEDPDDVKVAAVQPPVVNVNPMNARVRKRAKKELWLKRDTLPSSEKRKYRSIIKKLSDNDKYITKTLIDLDVKESQEGVKVALLFDKE